MHYCFDVFRSDREVGAGGETAIICRSALDPSSINFQCLDIAEFEYSAVIVNKLKIGGKLVVILSIYRPPSSTLG